MRRSIIIIFESQLNIKHLNLHDFIAEDMKSQYFEYKKYH
jgi:hypothetical protein